MRVNTRILQNLRERGQVNFVETKPKSSDPIQVIKNDSSQVTGYDKEYRVYTTGYEEHAGKKLWK